MHMLKIKNLNVYYGHIHAIKGISLRVEEGEIVSLIGANGAGKTTTMQTISGLLRAKSGSIDFMGRNLMKTEPHKVVELGIAQVLEGRRVFANLTVKENIQMGSYTVKDSLEGLRQARKDIYDKFPRLRERKEQLAGTLSGGEQQMLAMGRALMTRPRLLILDEPSMGLSPLLVKEIFEIIKEVNKSGVTVLLVEQNAKMALSVSDRAYVLETGKISIEGKADELMKNESIKKAYLGA
ncbi:ABC transporter ATP-binding protein [Clostridium sp. ASF356]|nr:ABC transporter ATP-binding protein [Clostridium sp. MD294]NDO45552.1 ABC transporter ATP-binding protein [Clostridium sp. MD294]USF30794.1 High-affinity branched-chain amino acid transport ATP-binding protein LivF [Clostridium sp. MD294]